MSDYPTRKEIDRRLSTINDYWRLTTMTPMKAIRLKCPDCCCGSANEVKLCACENCSLFPFRLGKNPFRQKREYTDEQKATMAERLAKAREAKIS